MAQTQSRAELRFLQFLSWFPLRLVLAFAGALAWLASWLPLRLVGAHRDVLLNMLICYPERSFAENQRHARRALVQTARTLASYSHVWLRPPEQAMNRIRTVHGQQAVQAAMDAQQPVLFLSLHQAAWEIPVLVIGEMGQAVIMYQPADNALDPVVKHARERTGCSLVPADGQGVREALAALAAGGCFGLLADHQPGGRHNPDANFFGHPVAVPAFVDKVVKKFKPAIFFVHAEYHSDDVYLDVHLTPADPAIYEGDEAATLQCMMDGLEAIIRNASDQYNWTYNRFRRGGSGKRDWYRKEKALALIERIRAGEPADVVFADPPSK